MLIVSGDNYCCMIAAIATMPLTPVIDAFLALAIAFESALISLLDLDG
jgi:hypothetical protein